MASPVWACRRHLGGLTCDFMETARVPLDQACPRSPVLHVIRHLVAIDREIRPANGSDCNEATAELAGRRTTDLQPHRSLLAGLEPAGFHHDRYQILLGRGTGTFQRAANGLKTWKAHTAPGFRVYPQDEEIRSGATVVVTLGAPFLALAAPCRIVRVIDEPITMGLCLPGLCPAIPRKERRHLLFLSHRTKRFSLRSWPFLGPAISSSPPLGSPRSRRSEGWHP